MGGSGHLENTLKAISRYIVFWFLISGVLLIGSWWIADQYLDVSSFLMLAGLGVLWIIISLTFGKIVTTKTTSPLKALSEAILHISPSPIAVASPDVEKLQLGRELVSSLVRQIYSLGGQNTIEQVNVQQPSLALQQLPLSILAIDDQATITFANLKMQQLANGQELQGKNLYNTFDILFQGNLTLQDWIKQTKSKAITAENIWRGVRISLYGEKVRYVDVAASYSKGVSDHDVILLALFDQNDFYSNQDNSLSFIALAVHELRTPLTILRGYIEVLEEEIAKQPNPQLVEIMRKMKASAENLTAFVGNILDVARADQNQLSLKLAKEDWPKVLTSIIENMQLRAEVHGKKLELAIAPGIPFVGIDRISIAEVMTNLIDNAIKYSPRDKTSIKVSTMLNQSGLIETSVQDFGVGIPESVMPNLFEKFSRNHRNRASIGGTGLGLYLSKALVLAHGGNIWVRSHEGQGSIFSFTVLPFDKVSENLQNSDNMITRNAHGWIKNHSLARK